MNITGLKKDHADLHGWLQSAAFGQLVQRPQVMKALMKWSKLTEQEVKTAIGPFQTEPFVIVKKLAGGEVGEFDPRQPSNIVIGEFYSITFGQYVRENKPGLLAPLKQHIEQSLLHELVHWGFKKKCPLEKEPTTGLPPGARDIGWAFEIDAGLPKH
jgi:hypothetical protein